MVQTLIERSMIDRSITGEETNFDVGPSESGTLYSSFGALAIITASLPPWSRNLHYGFMRNAAFDFRVGPDGADIIRLATSLIGGAGKYLQLDAAGVVVNLIAGPEPGIWEIETVNDITLLSVEP